MNRPDPRAGTAPRGLVDLFTELWRYYGVGVVNTAFGYGLFAGLVWLKLNLFVAQIVAHLCGMAFNYVMFRMHVFRGVRPKIWAYIGAYAFNYGLGLTFLALLHRFVASSYLAGFLAMLAASLVNYIVLKLFVFRRQPARP